MTLFFYTVIALITFVSFLHAWSKKNYDLSRTIVINRTKADVYNFVRQLKNQPKWIIWYKEDPKLIMKIRGEDGKMNALQYWRNSTKLVEGTQKIVKVKPGKVLETKILLVKPIKIVALSYIGVKEIQPGRTKIVLGFTGYLAFPITVISIFYSLEKILGSKIEESLQLLKNHLEQ